MKLVALTSLLLAGCAADSDSTAINDEPGIDEPGMGEPGMGIDEPVADGTYQVRTTLDLTVEALLPERLHAMVGTLRDFSQHPARTLFDVAEDAGVPAVADLRAALPAYLEDRLEGWIDDELAKLTIDGVPVPELAGNLAALAERSVGKFAIDSRLVIDGNTATHALVALDLSPAGLAQTVPLAVVPAATASCTQASGTLSIGTHGYALAYGEYVWQAIQAEVDIRATLGAAIACPTLARTIASKCYWGVCVGHTAELTELCERGLDEIVDRVHDQFTATRLDLLQLDAGTAAIAADSLTGTWSAQVNAGQGLRSAPASFTATR